MSETIIIAVITVITTIVSVFLSNKRFSSLTNYKIDQLELKVNKHNQLIERTYKLEERVAIAENDINIANHRIKSLEER